MNEIRYLVVNADDFGASDGINRGIVKAHRWGILTSTSLMVNAPRSIEAALLSRRCPTMSVGLHVHLVADHDDYRDELWRQLHRFRELLGHLPTHLDSHKNVHDNPTILPHFTECARVNGLPLRGRSSIRYLGKFYGQWDGQTHLEQISAEGLLRILDADVREGVTELGCHPGYADRDLRSSYSAEREAELRTLCDPVIRKALDERHIQLISFAEARGLRAGTRT
jgi:chitin disaccharide deacetylase